MNRINSTITSLIEFLNDIEKANNKESGIDNEAIKKMGAQALEHRLHELNKQMTISALIKDAKKLLE